MISCIRIPKAASSALVAAFTPVGHVPDREPMPHHPHRDNAGKVCAHGARLVDVPADTLAFAVLRDPVGRFRSAYDQFYNDGTGDMAYRYSDIDALIAAGPEAWMEPVFGCGFWPSVHWLHSAEYVRERGAIVMPYETFSNDLRAMGFWRPPISHAAHVRHTPTRLAEIMDYYAADIEMREELFGA